MTSSSTSFCIVGNSMSTPSEGMDVVSNALGQRLVAAGARVSFCGPQVDLKMLWLLYRRKFGAIVFVHGPGPGVILATRVLRKVTRSDLIVVATRPRVPQRLGLLGRMKGPHLVITNDLHGPIARFETQASVVQHFIGIEPTRVHVEQSELEPPRNGPMVLLHVGHLRANRGLDSLARIKARVGDAARVVLQASPTFEESQSLRAKLEAAGVEVRTGYVQDVTELYRECDLYVFPVPRHGGAVELPLTVLEALAAGRPVLATEFGVLADALRDVAGATVVPEVELEDLVCELVENRAQLPQRRPGLPPHLALSTVADAILNYVGRQDA